MRPRPALPTVPAVLADTLPLLRCPVCGPAVRVHVRTLLARETDGEMLEAVLVCEECLRWYRVEEGIPDLVRDGLREAEAERDFLQRHRTQLPPEVLDGKPFGIAGPLPSRSEADARIVDEGRHWGRFMRRFWDVGDRSIFDIRIPGTHPPFFVAGVLEPDDRDFHRRWGNFPHKTGELAFARLGELAGKRGVDVGCGGGQFGLEAARQGVRMIGFDPSFEEVSLARRHARAHGKPPIDYLRAEPAHPPLPADAFDLMMAKDALHHVPDLGTVFPALLKILRPRARLVIHEHVAKPARKNGLMARIAPRMVERIRRRYPTVHIPAELLRDSANEDIAADQIRGVVRRHFDALGEREDLFLANDLEMFVHFAFGKRRWLSRPAHAAGAALESALLALGDRQHWTFVGELRGR